MNSKKKFIFVPQPQAWALLMYCTASAQCRDKACLVRPSQLSQVSQMRNCRDKACLVRPSPVIPVIPSAATRLNLTLKT